MKNLVTIHVTSYNRYERLKSCIASFFATNLYDNDSIELVIVDNGSTDARVTEYIKNLDVPCSSYKYILNEKNDYPNCLRFAKVQAREIASGKFYIDCPDDHLFVVKSDWIQRAIDHVHSNEDVGCVIHFAQPEYRYRKQNNKMVLHDENDAYFKSLLKGYADYHLMSAATYESLGDYDYGLGRSSEGEYMERALSAGYFRNIMKYPVAIVNDDNFSLSSCLSEEEYTSHFGQFLPVTNEQLIEFCKRNSTIRHEGAC